MCSPPGAYYQVQVLDHRVSYDLEELALHWYDQAYAFCDQLGIVKIAHRLTAKQRAEAKQGCDHSIICSMAEGCGRRNCPARTVSVDYYVRRIKGTV